jgi:hypothetical protein
MQKEAGTIYKAIKEKSEQLITEDSQTNQDIREGPQE